MYEISLRRLIQVHMIQSRSLLGRSQGRCEISDWCSGWHENHEWRGDWDALESLV